MVEELYAATPGIETMIMVAGTTFQTDKVFVGVLVFAITGMVATEIVDRPEKIWQMAARGGVRTLGFYRQRRQMMEWLNPSYRASRIKQASPTN